MQVQQQPKVESSDSLITYIETEIAKLKIERQRVALEVEISRENWENCRTALLKRSSDALNNPTTINEARKIAGKAEYDQSVLMLNAHIADLRRIDYVLSELHNMLLSSSSTESLTDASQDSSTRVSRKT